MAIQGVSFTMQVDFEKHECKEIKIYRKSESWKITLERNLNVFSLKTRR